MKKMKTRRNTRDICMPIKILRDESVVETVSYTRLIHNRQLLDSGASRERLVDGCIAENYWGTLERY